MFKIAASDAEIAECHDVMVQLRPHIAAEDFVAIVRRMMSGGYHLSYYRHEGRIVAVAGFRIYEMLYSGRQLYIDDLVTDASTRSSGHGRALLAAVEAHARASGCQQLHLDSGVHRHGAHRFYFREGMHILGYHFTKQI